MTTFNHKSTDDMFRYASFVLDTIRRVGMTEAVRENLDGWHMTMAGFAMHPMGYLGFGSGKANYEVIIEHESGVSLVLRDYGANGQVRRSTWAIHSDENVGREAAMAHMVNYYLQKDDAA